MASKSKECEKNRPVVVCYNSPAASVVCHQEYNEKRELALKSILRTRITVPRKSARAWVVRKNELCRITVSEGSQVGDVNLWNLTNPKERFYSGKTRQLHASHLSSYDRLWSCLPYLRPMATIVADSINYGIDEDGAGVHDVIGTRCDGYTYKLITGQESETSCHQQLVKAVREFGLSEEDIHDVWNIFMCTGFTKKTHQYFTKASPAKIGDYIEFIADMDLIVALSTCPQGDVSTPVGEKVPDSKCFPLQVEVFTAEC
ncbi:hypothetical protein V9T40_006246 [Parthenolecanium corni]|uniref:DUF1989 domain-containing protein n=1 Tax=Parthenolecanium corni TaxID=536013 RepID=A0AAN9YBP1_9HEMI